MQYTSKFSGEEIDSILDNVASKQDAIPDLETIRSNAKNASDTIARMVESGYLFAGIATIGTNPGIPDAKVFYIANGKGTYTKFGGLEVTEDEVVVLYWDTAWHKVATGIASQEKLSELERKFGEVVIPMVDGAYIATNLSVGAQVNITPIVKSGWRYSIFPVSEGDKLTITAYGGGSPKPFAFVDENYVMVENTTLVSTESLEIVTPKNAKYVIINDSKNGISYYVSDNSAETRINNINENIESLKREDEFSRELITMSGNGLTYFDPLLFTNGTITPSGELITTKKYSVANTDIQVASEDIEIATIDEAFRAHIYYYIDGVYDSAVGDIVVPFVIEKGKEFRLMIIRKEVDMNEIADINTFVRAISIKTKIGTLVEDDSTPLGKILHDGGYTRLLHHIGCIGDSLSSGAVFKKLPDGTYVGEDKYDYSWPQEIARICNITCYNFSVGGLSTRSWIENFIKRTGQHTGKIKFLEDYPCEAYTIALGVNDANSGGSNYVPIGSPSDIDLDNMDNNADTFYGNYAHIIQFIKSVVPKAKIFLITDPRDGAFNTPYREAVRYMATIFSNVYLVDLYKYGKHYYTNEVLLDDLWVSGHLTAQGYIRSAWHISTYIDWIIRNNKKDFMEVPYILET